MKENELMIGNYVYSTALERNIIVNEICYDEEYERYSVSVKNEFNDLITAFKPILLTEDRLLKFGAEKTEHKNGNSFKLQYSYSSGFKEFIEITNKGSLEKPMFFCFLTSNHGKHFVLSLEYKYVHLFQNLYFSLCNKELKSE